MTRLLTLTLLVAAELPHTALGCETSAREIAKRIDEVDEGSPLYEQAHARLDALITLRETLLDRGAAKSSGEISR